MRACWWTGGYETNAVKVNHARPCHGIGRRFCICCICMDADFCNSHSMGDGVQILFIYLYFIE